MPQVRACLKCDQLIRFIRSAKTQKFMPVNAEEITIINEYGEAVRGNRPHWETCPFADEFRNNNNQNAERKK
jgi:hypothetical protein